MTNMTNANRIRTMTDEELSELFADISACTGCKAKIVDKSQPCKGLYSGCQNNWLNWLKQEEEES